MTDRRRAWRAILTGVAMLAVLAGAGAAGAQALELPGCEAQLVPPVLSGYDPPRELLDVSGKEVLALGYSRPGEDEVAIRVSFERLPSTIRRDGITVQQLRQRYGPAAKLVAARWSGFAVTQIVDPGGITFALEVDLPVDPASVRVRAVAERELRGDVEALMPQVLDGLSADSYWTRSIFGTDLAASGVYLVLLLMLLGGASLVLFFTLAVAYRKLGAGRCIAMGIVLLLGGLFLPSGRLVELTFLQLFLRIAGVMLVTIGILSLLGLAEGLLGFMTRRLSPLGRMMI